MTTFTVTDASSGIERSYTNDATGFEAAFEDFVSPEDRAKLAQKLTDGVVFESWSGKSTGVIERDREPLRYWTAMCALIETDNQVWNFE